MLVYSKLYGPEVKLGTSNVIKVPIDIKRINIYQSLLDEEFITFKDSDNYNYLGTYQGKFKKIIALNSNKIISKINPT